MTAAANRITFAIPKGTLFKPSIKLLEAVGFNCEPLKRESRQLVFSDQSRGVQYIICRPTDIPTFVEYGSADFGLVGKDTIVEQQKDVCELLDLRYGGCRFVVAVPERLKDIKLEQWGRARVATKFPRVAEEYFRSIGLQMEIIKLHGNIELAPIVGLAEMIVDIVSTGRTLRENNLVPVAEVMNSTARLIANRVSHRYKAERVNALVEKFRNAVNGGLFDD
ncbi:ATP phosphoribosyltransferase [Desulfohalotomaculum tongense]|uniref:ATP phosphoribosyltransferase n=1 Tax=Desulforadius tongensis TaxID=1216062 RepID=UPI001958E42F|nr:ATP phosphoribosyltransferase [Desulforadius tongensis]MBM7854262.1 ATP phosphoribosyltransferase [Desulforadius tongensis]